MTLSGLIPFYGGQGGRKLTWKCFGGPKDYSSVLVSVTGLQFATSFDGEIKFPQITVVFSGGEVPPGEFTLSLQDDFSGETVPLGQWYPETKETIGTQHTITAVHAAGRKIPEGDFNHFTALASEPRALAYHWLREASQISAGLMTVTAYTDPYHERQASRVAAPASTLAGLAGFSNATSRTGIRKGDERGSGQWGTSWTYFDDIPLTIDVQWDVTPGYNGFGSFVSNMPLYWHQAGQYWHITWTGRSKWPSVSSDKSQFPMGHTQYIALEVKCQGGNIFNPTTSLKPQDYNNPDSTEDIEITFKSRKEAKEFYRANAGYIPPGGPKGWGWSGYGNTGSDIKRWGGSRTVKITDVALYEGCLSPFYSYSKAAIAPTAANVICGNSEAVEFGERVMLGTNAAATTRLQAMLAVANFQYIPQRMDSAWISIGVNSAANLCPGYEIIQDVYPITINQLYTTRDFFKQACILGSLGFYLTGGKSIFGVETCPEAGEIFELPLTTSTVISINAATSYPMPQAYEITLKDPHNNDHTYNYADMNGEGNVQSIGIMQGSFSPGQSPYTSGSTDYMAIGGELWQDNPGSLADRWTGSSYNSSTGVTFPVEQTVSHTAAESGLYWLAEDGTLWPRFAARPTSYTAGLKYAVRDQVGNEYKLFASNGYMEFSGSAPPAGKYSAPLIDAYPLMSFLKAHARVFGDNYNRQSYNVQTTLGFASVQPGDVVAIQLEQIFDGSPTLALVLGISLSTDSFPTLEIVPMHKITASDYSVWSNLEAVLK